MKVFQKRSKILALSLVCILVAAVIAITIIIPARRTAWQKEHPLSNPTLGFQMYKPTVLPRDISIKEAAIDVGGKNPDKLWFVVVVMRLDMKQGMYTIDQSRVEPEDIDESRTSLNNYDPTSINITCTQRVSPEGTRYRLCHWVEFGKFSVFEQKFIVADTAISASLPAPMDKPLTFEEMDTFVDSFVPGDPEGLEVWENVV